MNGTKTNLYFCKGKLLPVLFFSRKLKLSAKGKVRMLLPLRHNSNHTRVIQDKETPRVSTQPNRVPFRRLIWFSRKKSSYISPSFSTYSLDLRERKRKNEAKNRTHKRKLQRSTVYSVRRECENTLHSRTFQKVFSPSFGVLLYCQQIYSECFSMS